MIRNISQEGLRELFEQYSASAMLPLVSFYRPDSSEYARIVGNTENIEHNGATYIGLPFELTLPSSSDEEIPQPTIRISNVDRTLVDLLRSVTDPPLVSLEIIMVDSAGDTRTELGPMEFSLQEATGDASMVTIKIGYDNDILNSPATGDIFNPGTAPALFAS